MADNDTQTELKKRARRRLVGAAALALLAAIVLPLVMEHEPKQAGQDIQIRIPSQEGANFASRVIQGGGPAPAKPSLPPEDDAAVSAVKPSNAVPMPPSPVEAPPAATELSNVAPPKATEKPVEKPSVAQDAPAKKPEAIVKRDEAQRAAAILSGEKALAADASGYVVQLGVFKDANNAASVKGKAKAQGVSAYAENLGDKTRVRAGPFATREAADAAAAKLRKAGLTAVVTPRT
ncbi:SPOR domain-containing protein [Niveibacterium sp. 24ML]|uniref:SPOR domain-containing protein n=1 Tax=Niveibacterium sp. 24ML TaxID=2985512 RepID=UPI002271DB41|nr:SPOR domain-containing protein [Niveibacterium sp. 24ML]MCX9155141.1 SPOR domain-containing protein [Niveibacterium sp. 24ML]